MTSAQPRPSASDHPATGRFDYPIYHVETRPQWRSWLERNHTTTRGVWLCSWRTGTGRLRCPYPEVVEEAICFGWIDSTATLLDDDRGLQLITPRKAKSPWSRLNRQRATDMERLGLMTEAGRAQIDAAKANGWWTISDQVEDLQEPTDLTTALDQHPQARANWDRFPPSARKQMLWRIVSAARPATRASRIAATIAEAANGRQAQG
ncbi:MAG: hypothetical protein GY708_21085 [Actinomycetia bacterium]|nr:hypothetical protein [Actinomycetes bacterium]